MKKSLFLLLIFLFIFQISLTQNNELDIKLFKAIKENNIEAVKEIISKGANVNSIDENGASGLMWAAFISDLQTVKYLIDKNADNLQTGGVIYIDSARTAYYGNLLGIVASENKLDILKYLLKI